jgi:hypothetical protein
MVVEWLIRQGIWEGVARRFRVARLASGYVGIDVFLFFILFFAGRWSGSIKRFGEAVKAHRAELAALGGRRELATPASVSRFCAVVRPEHGHDLAPWLLLEACDAAPTLRHPAAATYDTRGDAWHMFDFDGTVEPVRQRALPHDLTLREPKRHSEGMGRAGYVC